jgi:ATP-dependent helicase/DNAse subunit B
MFLFYTAATRATERLYLTHPLVDTEGREAMPSYYVSEVERLFDKLPTERISSAEVLPSHEDAVCPREMLAAALADGVAAKNPAAFVPQSLRKLANREMPSLEPLALALKVTHERESERPYGKFDGVISDREIQKRLEASMRGAVLSASRLSLYGTCPFRYFTQRVLGLEEIIEPEDELTSVNRGKFFHSVLRDFVMQLRDGGSTVILKRNCETAAKLLEQIANVHFEWIRRNGEVANEVVFQAEQGEILDILRAFVAKEAETNEENLSTPTRFEMAFGFEKPLSIWDPASTTNPLVISGGPFPIRVRGVIDRLDRTADGWVVIDYKSGSSAPSKSKFVDGSDLQLPLYAIAVNELFSDGATKIVDGFYYRLRDGSHPGRLQYGNPKPPELYEIVKKHAVAHVANICAGRFPPSPRDDNACNSCAACGVCGYSETRTERKSTNDDGPD